MYNISNNCNSKLIFRVELFSIKAKYKFGYFIILINNSLRKGKIPSLINKNKSELISILLIFFKILSNSKIICLKKLTILIFVNIASSFIFFFLYISSKKIIF